MAAKLDPFVDVLLREHGDQLYLLPDEPVTLVKDGKPRKVSKQPLTDQHIYALLVEVAPSESANQDRKSTRLNSSHSQISYAVFCLHKKLARYPRRNDSSSSLPFTALWKTQGGIAYPRLRATSPRRRPITSNHRPHGA